MQKLKKKHYIVLVVALLLAALPLFCSFQIKGHYYGLYLLKGEHGRLLTLQDDLLFGEGDRLVCGIPLAHLHSLLKPAEAHASNESYLDLDWDARDGSGTLRSVYPDHTEMHFYFSRALSDAGQAKHGLFVGGSMPQGAVESDVQQHNDSGIAFFDGRQVWHVWCNANEALIPVDRAQPAIQTGDWRFLGSRVELDSPGRVVISSRHEVTVDGIPLQIERRAYFRAGERFGELSIAIRNVGHGSARYIYTYGDEPWLGNYGSSDDDFGWTDRELVTTESLIDTRHNHYAGMVNLKFNLANFIAWGQGSLPTFGCFSNAIGKVAPAQHLPLSSNDRFLGLQWGPLTLQPGDVQTIRLTIGLAEVDPTTHRPHLPAQLTAANQL